MMPDDLWASEGVDQYEIAPALAIAISELARRRATQAGTMTIDAALFQELAPRSARHFEDAARLLAELGISTVTRVEPSAT
ncbi:MAG: hypothetical protein AAF500_12585 [Myxococcota bacterium]